jgi:class 3 adenylate cyclase/DNA-binding MarR family transcriptional regulator
MNKPQSVTQRRLAAIFCADAAGYARLMSIDEASAFSLLNSHYEIIDRQIIRYGGRTANTAGDSILAEFPSSIDAVKCALDIQERVADANEDVSRERQVIFRIGVHVGEIIVRNGDLFGDGVNIAARMEKLAPPGCVCLSEMAYQYASKALNVAFDDLGPQLFKNLSTPIRAYIIRPVSNPLSWAIPSVHRQSEVNLARRFHRVLTAAVLRFAAPEGLTPVEPTVLASLHDAPAIDEKRLAERIGVDPAHVQRMIKHLQRRGLVRRVDSLGVRPRHLFSLTPEGLELFSRLYPAILAARDEIMSSLSQRERETLLSLLARVITANERKSSRYSPSRFEQSSVGSHSESTYLREGYLSETRAAYWHRPAAVGSRQRAYDEGLFLTTSCEQGR